MLRPEGTHEFEFQGHGVYRFCISIVGAALGNGKRYSPPAAGPGGGRLGDIKTQATSAMRYYAQRFLNNQHS